MRLLLRVAIGCVVPVMDSNQLHAIEYLQRVGIIDDVHTLPDILLGHAVMVLVEHHIAVAHHGDCLA